MAIFRDELLKQNETMLKQDTTKYGFDSETGIRLDKIGDSWLWQREDNAGNNMIRLYPNRNYGYTLEEQGDFELYDYTLITANNTIAIIQSTSVIQTTYTYPQVVRIVPWDNQDGRTILSQSRVIPLQCYKWQ